MAAVERRVMQGVAAVVLAGGQGRRMGGADKGLIDYQGRPLIEWVLATLAPQVSEIVISANRNLERYAAYGRRVLPDTLPDYPGPLAGVLAALLAVTSDWLLVVPCDTPHLPADLALRLLGAAQLKDVPLAVAEDAARVHHSCFIVRADQRDHLAAFLARGERAVRRWQATLPSATVRFDAAAFANINRPDDLES
ncbi:MAG: molybdenum cofactor guanylyltransferase [Betaproteobacteria bacterium]|nr:molybdenum cofactor guanylyltransferase [Betaproteobacteria bacterium]